MAPFGLRMPRIGFLRQGENLNSNKSNVSERTETPVQPLHPAQPAITISGTSTPRQLRSLSPISQLLSNTNSNQQSVSPILSQEAVFRAAIDAAGATYAIPETAAPQTQRDKLKARLRQLLLRKWILRLLLGKQLADFVYPWVHPKSAHGGLPTL